MGSQQSEFIWVFYKGFSAWRSVFAVKKNAFLNPSLHTCTMGYLESIKYKIFWICQKPACIRGFVLRFQKIWACVILNQILFRKPPKEYLDILLEPFWLKIAYSVSLLSLLTLLLKPWKCNDIINGMKGKQIV